MSVFDWSTDADANDVADSGIPAFDTAPARTFPVLVRGVMAGVAAYIADQSGLAAMRDSANVYTVATKSGVTSLKDGLHLVVRPNLTNTAQASLVVDGLGARFWRDANGADFAAGAIAVGRFYRIAFDATANVWRVL